jgi:excisionase family DNA binding protein
MNRKLAYRIAEAAEVLGISRSKAYELVASGELPSVKIGTVRRVPVTALEAKLNEQIEQHDPAAR